LLPTATAPNAESVPFMLVRSTVATAPEIEPEPESSRAVDARRPPARANVTLEDLPSIIVEAPPPAPEGLLAPIDVPLVARPLTPVSVMVWPSGVAVAPARFVSQVPARGATPARAVAVALLGIMMGLAVGGSAVAWRTHGAALPSFVTLAR
jgi:hypothetical protein